MTVLFIVRYGYPTLRERAKEVTGDSPELQRLIDDMFETMYAAPGVGLAAPQVGVGLRLFVMDPAGNRADRDSSPRVLINPEIIEESAEDESLEEGCLSLPTLKGDVYRSLRLRIRYLDRTFVQHEEEWFDFEARIFQHEFDHLDGKLFFDRFPLIRRTALGPRLMRLRSDGDAALKMLHDRLADADVKGGPPWPDLCPELRTPDED